MYGGAGNDYIQGGGGDDVISGGTGANELHGYGGNDTFIFEDKVGSVNIIMDFNIYDSDEKDKIQLNPEGNQKYFLSKLDAGGAIIMNSTTLGQMIIAHETDLNNVVDAMGGTAVMNSNAQLSHYVDAAGNEITLA